MLHSVIGNNILYIDWNIQFCVGEIIYHEEISIYNLRMKIGR